MTKEERVNVDIVLSPKQIKEIRDLHARGYRESDIAKKLDVPGKSVINHLKGERARRLEEQYKQLYIGQLFEHSELSRTKSSPFSKIHVFRRAVQKLDPLVQKSAIVGRKDRHNASSFEII